MNEATNKAAAAIRAERDQVAAELAAAETSLARLDAACDGLAEAVAAGVGVAEAVAEAKAARAEAAALLSAPPTFRATGEVVSVGPDTVAVRLDTPANLQGVVVHIATADAAKVETGRNVTLIFDGPAPANEAVAELAAAILSNAEAAPT